MRIGRPHPDGWMDIEIDGPSPEVLAAQLAGLGARVEVLDPPEARERLARLAIELATLYGTPTKTGNGPTIPAGTVPTPPSPEPRSAGSGTEG
ncbi:WYL domain-containing protein [Streptomyces inhibens]|uniref:WYL domain-containing protein n=1 Tax=Streptomyces inhibens TaxID=2293571 RepID=UPI0036D1F436